MPRRQRRGRDRAGAQPPGQAVRAPVGRLPEQHDGRRRPLRLRQRQLGHAGLVERGPPARTAQLHPDRRPDLVHPRPQQRDLHDPRSRRWASRSAIRSPDEVRTFNGWVDVNYKPAPGSTPFPACWSDEFAAPSGAPSGAPGGLDRPERAQGRRHRVRDRVHDAGRDRAGRQGLRHRLRQPGRRASPHNIQIKDSTGAVKFTGATFNGVATQPYQVPALAAGSYPFLCTVHPTMTGTLDRSSDVAAGRHRSAGEDGGRWRSRRSDREPRCRDGGPCSGCSTPTAGAGPRSRRSCG